VSRAKALRYNSTLQRHCTTARYNGTPRSRATIARQDRTPEPHAGSRTPEPHAITARKDRTPGSHARIGRTGSEEQESMNRSDNRNTTTA
jgi:hypothetical protein